MMLRRFTRDDLDHLIAVKGGPHLSLFLSPPAKINAADQDRVRINNLARQTHETLAEYWMSGSDADAFLEPLHSFANDPELSTARSHGIALFLCSGSLESFRVETPIKERLVIARGFHVRPLLPSLEQLEAYCLLTLSQKRAALYAGTPSGMERITLPGLSESFEQLQESLTAQPGSQTHTAAVGLRTKQGAVFHGQGGISDAEKADLENYLKHVDDSVKSYIGKHPGTPLILAGVDSLVAMFRSVSKCDSILTESISGNVDQLSTDELRERVSGIVDGELNRRREQQASRIREHDVPATTDPERILVAASEGRIETLFIDQDAEQYGMFMADRGILTQLHDAPTGDPADASHDLIELAAVQTLKTGGTVHAVSATEMPIAKAMAAGLRF